MAFRANEIVMENVLEQIVLSIKHLSPDLMELAAEMLQPKLCQKLRIRKRDCTEWVPPICIAVIGGYAHKNSSAASWSRNLQRKAMPSADTVSQNLELSGLHH